jgi:hypothetical protein
MDYVGDASLTGLLDGRHIHQLMYRSLNSATKGRLCVAICNVQKRELYEVEDHMYFYMLILSHRVSLLCNVAVANNTSISQELCQFADGVPPY